ncbi:MAG TPA: SGNH/GDSL hydrolase family protein [Pyrinomonadaceae bacterium]|nr:SGNH/GDSL hydrolase family protein [Pyrinomonadaceae bacterium]
MDDSNEVLTTSSPAPKQAIPLRRRIGYLSILYLCFLVALASIELGTRALLPHLSSLELFVNTPQQKLQVANEKQSTIFEGDPLLLWRLRPNLDHVVWDFTVLSTNAQHYRSDYPIGSKAPGTIRIVCLGDSVTFGYRVPVVWPDKPTEYDRAWLPFPMLLEKQLQAANPGRHIEGIAMAVPGYTTHQGLAWLQRDIDSLQPDLLIVSFGWNDASFSDVADRDTIRTNWYYVGVRWLIDHSQAFAHASHWLRSGSSPAKNRPVRPVARVSDQEYVSNVRAIVNLARSRGSKVLVLAAPYRDAETNPIEAKLMTHYRDELRTAMQQDQVPFLVVPELTEAAHPSNERWFGELIHPNHIGHRLIASELLKSFPQDHLLENLNIPLLIP